MFQIPAGKRPDKHAVDFLAGEPLNFKTEFSDLHFMVPVIHDVNDQDREIVLRFGYFRSRWEKPSESVYATLEDDPIIQDTRLDTQGISGSYEDGLFDPGWGWRIDSDWGILGAELTSPVSNDNIGGRESNINSQLSPSSRLYNI